MEERTSWRGAVGTAWENLTGFSSEGNIRVIRAVFFLIFLLGTAWAVWSYLQGIELMELEQARAVSQTNPAQADKTRLDTMISQVKVTSELRAVSPRTVEIMQESLAKYPFREPLFEVALPPAEDIPSVTAVEPPSVVYIDYPPEGITLRGIMIVGKQHVAVMDIPGVGTGMVVKAGDTFMQRRGRVVRVAPDKVVVNWGGQNWDIAPSF